VVGGGEVEEVLYPPYRVLFQEGRLLLKDTRKFPSKHSERRKRGKKESYPVSHLPPFDTHTHTQQQQNTLCNCVCEKKRESEAEKCIFSLPAGGEISIYAL